MLWATFMASGKTQYVERIIGVLAFPIDGDQQEERMQNIMLVGAAKWSLSSNAFQHDLVYETCKKFIESENPRIREAVLEVIANVDESKAQESATH